VAVVDRSGAPPLEQRVATQAPSQLPTVLAPYRPLEAVVETCPAWPWLHDLLVPAGVGFHLAHAKELEAIANAAKEDRRARRAAAGLGGSRPG
jgi:hypothetical protein